MKQITLNTGRCKYVLLTALLAIVVLPLFNSCKKTTTDTSELLATVPSSAGIVVGVNLQSLLEKAGCKVDGTKITTGKDLEGAIECQQQLGSGMKEAIKLFLSGESGIDPTGAIYFVDAYDNYVTAAVADENKFTTYVAQQTGKEFEDAGNNVRVAANVALVGTQMWINVGSDNINAKAVANYSNLEATQSFSSTPGGERIATMSNDIVGYGQLNALMRRGGGFADLSMGNLLLGMLFENASGVNFQIDFLKGKLSAQAVLINDKWAPAKYLLPDDRIDTDLVGALSQDAGLVAAANVSKELVKKVSKMLESFGGKLFGDMNKTFGSLDGTVAIACSDYSDMEEGVSGVVTTDGKPTIELTSLISQIAPVRNEGSKIYFAKNTPAGDVNVAEAAKFMKGATIAWVGSVNDDEKVLSGKLPENVLKTTALALRPEGKGLKIDLEMTAVNSDENILLALIRSAN